ncbi:3-phosphoserine/phosphohydroxythreonine transaminase [Pseudalkalibacillus salsuginis]|uniref:3-phosphoserine/phosphohydroxythreonine transaminase n=1 Tax=Pseudalkalibacillus salsuginis TaxID=2910972 RepID=UPI001F3B466C|nr:3-phosphoserine/phosphohydroxythreonine transaminase [Pseudalkalibacillus salsuginis]MCF6411045.1 3-phosphoserine/phosphohydroxythreonine transaminase [Pseudalkalibacillus salsuginis]
METFNFNPGPTALPKEVLLRAQQELVNYLDTGLSILEMSHRSKAYQSIHENAQQSLRKFLNIPETHEILFLQGGASLQFTMVPMNLLKESQSASYIVTGSWSQKAYKESMKIGKTEITASSEASGFTHIPDKSDWKGLDKDISYLHVTSNNTIYGTQWQTFEELPDVPLVIDMSSDIGSRTVPWEKVVLAYAGAQKNIGPAGATVVIIRKDVLAETNTQLPAMLDYKVHSNKNSLYNTPPTYSIYLLGLTIEWMIEQGGLTEFIHRSEQKASLLYNTIDESDGFYTGHAEKSSRSRMNITFNLPNSELSKAFLQGTEDEGFVGLSGHRSVGGCRASLYNGVGLASCERLVNYMEKFKKKHS